MTVSGASRFLVSSTLANEKGLGAARPQLLGGASLLEAGRRINRSGIGLSASSRAQTEKFLASANGQGTALFGLSSGASLSVSDLAQQIKALRASLPKDKISPLVLAAEQAKEAEDKEAALEALKEEALSAVKYKRGMSEQEAKAFVEETYRKLEAKYNEQQATARSNTFRRGLTLDEQA